MDSTAQTNQELMLALLKKHTLCTHCLGRQFALIGSGASNYERGSALIMSRIMDEIVSDNPRTEVLTLLAKTGHPFALGSLTRLGVSDSEDKELQPACEICNNIFDKAKQFAEKALQASKEIEFETFLFGSSFPPNWLVREEEIWAEYAIKHAESIKGHLNREIGKIFYELTGKAHSRDNPDILFVVDVDSERIEIKIRSVYILGRYRKLIRDIPQTKWPCSNCEGVGCKECSYTGKRYATSVEELISPILVQAFDGRGSKFHGAGREDVDARMLGTGRPFVVEVLSPRKRTADLRDLERQINEAASGKVEVLNLELVDKATMQSLKENSAKAVKVYRAKIKCESPITKEMLEKLAESFSDQKLIKQRTPNRVMHRRADLLRHKVVYSVRIDEVISETEFIATIEGQGGLYIKELISGDEGRTEPSFSSMLGIKCQCVELDVIEVRN